MCHNCINDLTNSFLWNYFKAIWCFFRTSQIISCNLFFHSRKWRCQLQPCFPAFISLITVLNLPGFSNFAIPYVKDRHILCNEICHMCVCKKLETKTPIRVMVMWLVGLMLIVFTIILSPLRAILWRKLAGFISVFILYKEYSLKVKLWLLTLSIFQSFNFSSVEL